MKNVQNVLTKGEELLDKALGNVYVSTSLKVFLVLYAALAAPELPKNVSDILNNVVVRIIAAAIIVLLATKDPSLAIISSIAFVLTLEAANKYNLINTSQSYSKKGDTSWLPSSKNEEEATQEDNSENDIKLPPKPAVASTITILDKIVLFFDK